MVKTAVGGYACLLCCTKQEKKYGVAPAFHPRFRLQLPQLFYRPGRDERGAALRKRYSSTAVLLVGLQLVNRAGANGAATGMLQRTTGNVTDVPDSSVRQTRPLRYGQDPPHSGDDIMR